MTEVQPIHYARAALQLLQEKIPTKHQFAGAWLAKAAQEDEELLDIVVQESGAHELWWNMCAFSIEFFSRSGKPIPPSLAQLASQAMLGNAKPPSRKGRPSNEYRDLIVGHAVRKVSNRYPTIPITRNRATESESVCSLVSEALKHEDHYLSEAVVEKIWEGHRRRRSETIN